MFLTLAGIVVALLVIESPSNSMDFLLKVAAVFGAGALLERRFGRLERKIDHVYAIMPKPPGSDPGPFEEKK
jgi:hypothetical protein